MPPDLLSPFLILEPTKHHQLLLVSNKRFRTVMKLIWILLNVLTPDSWLINFFLVCFLMYAAPSLLRFWLNTLFLVVFVSEQRKHFLHLNLLLLVLSLKRCVLRQPEQNEILM